MIEKINEQSSANLFDTGKYYEKNQNIHVLAPSSTPIEVLIPMMEKSGNKILDTNFFTILASVIPKGLFGITNLKIKGPNTKWVPMASVMKHQIITTVKIKQM